MSETTRTFIAVVVPPALELKLSRLQGQLAGEAPEARWETPRPYHLTLAFLGDVGHGELNQVCLAVASAAEKFGRFDLELRGIGAFPSPEKPRVIWAGVAGQGLETLGALKAAIDEAVTRLNYRPEERFHPHVTLGRFGHGRRPTRDLTPVVSHYRTWHAGPFTSAEVVTFGSSPTRDGPAYAALGRAPLKGAKRGTLP